MHFLIGKWKTFSNNLFIYGSTYSALMFLPSKDCSIHLHASLDRRASHPNSCNFQRGHINVNLDFFCVIFLLFSILVTDILLVGPTFALKIPTSIIWAKFLLVGTSLKGIWGNTPCPCTPHKPALFRCALFYIGHNSILLTEVSTYLWDEFRPELGINAIRPATPVALHSIDLSWRTVQNSFLGGDFMSSLYIAVHIATFAYRADTWIRLKLQIAAVQLKLTLGEQVSKHRYSIIHKLSHLLNLSLHDQVSWATVIPTACSNYISIQVYVAVLPGPHARFLKFTWFNNDSNDQVRYK